MMQRNSSITSLRKSLDLSELWQKTVFSCTALHTISFGSPLPSVGDLGQSPSLFQSLDVPFSGIKKKTPTSCALHWLPLAPPGWISGAGGRSEVNGAVAAGRDPKANSSPQALCHWVRQGPLPSRDFGRCTFPGHRLYSEGVAHLTHPHSCSEQRELAHKGHLRSHGRKCPFKIALDQLTFMRSL